MIIPDAFRASTVPDPVAASSEDSVGPADFWASAAASLAAAAESLDAAAVMTAEAGAVPVIRTMVKKARTCGMINLFFSLILLFQSCVMAVPQLCAAAAVLVPVLFHCCAPRQLC